MLSAEHAFAPSELSWCARHHNHCHLHHSAHRRAQFTKRVPDRTSAAGSTASVQAKQRPRLTMFVAGVSCVDSSQQGLRRHNAGPCFPALVVSGDESRRTSVCWSVHPRLMPSMSRPFLAICASSSGSGGAHDSWACHARETGSCID